MAGVEGQARPAGGVMVVSEPPRTATTATSRSPAVVALPHFAVSVVSAPLFWPVARWTRAMDARAGPVAARIAAAASPTVASRTLGIASRRAASAVHGAE